MRERTIKNKVEISGIGLQTGGKVRMELESAPPGSGVVFKRTDIAGSPAIRLKDIIFGSQESKERRTAIKMGPFEVQTTEHFLAAVSALSIDDITVGLDSSELPGLDGSAKDFFRLLKDAGISEGGRRKDPIKISAPLWAGDGAAFIAIFPDTVFRVSYTLSYAAPCIGTQFFSTIIDESIFEKEIAPARTFCLEAEAKELLKRGLGKGANYDNTLVIGADGPINNRFRFPDEPVRHKILDLVGDLAILGSRIEGHVVAIKSGHRLNMELVKMIKESGNIRG